MYVLVLGGSKYLQVASKSNKIPLLTLINVMPTKLQCNTFFHSDPSYSRKSYEILQS